MIARAIIAALTILVAAPAWSQTPPVTGGFEVPSRPVWAGQVFDLTLAWRVDWAGFSNLEGPLAWRSDPLVAEPWSAPSLRDAPAADTTAVVTLRTRAMALRPGHVTLEPARQVMVLRTGTVRTDEYERAITAPVPVQSAGQRLNVRPLPPPPPGFGGAIGRFTLASRVDKTTLRVGETSTWTLTLAGSGNWPSIHGLPARQVSRDFDVIGAPDLKTAPHATLFERSLRETVVLSPRQAGRYILGAVDLVVFDPDTGRYVTVRAPPITLDIQPGLNGEGARAETPPPRVDASGRTLPRLLAGSGRAPTLPGDRVWFSLLASVMATIPGLWLLLALCRAHASDPNREARRAHAGLGVTLRRLCAISDPEATRGLIRAWQRDTGRRWQLDRQAPTPRAFADENWRRLWIEGDRLLYARSTALPPDWLQRAAQALAALGPPPAFAPQRALRLKNLLPVLVALAVVSIGVTWSPPVRAADTSEAALRAALERRPLDWRTRHNLAVTLAAQERWDEAAGQAAVAFAHQPTVRETRDLWALTAERAGYSLELGASVLRPVGWRGRLAALASAAVWRWACVGFAGLAATGAAVVLLWRFGRIPRQAWPGGAVILGAANAGLLATTLALSAYGPLASPAAVVVWRATPLRALPVDTPAETAPSQLAAGAVMKADARFLSWRRVSLESGRAGWVRDDGLLQIWP